jgi:hypothetical protein
MSKTLLQERNLDIDEFTGGSFKQKDSKIDQRNGNVLIAPYSSLVEILINEENG